MVWAPARCGSTLRCAAQRGFGRREVAPEARDADVLMRQPVRRIDLRQLLERPQRVGVAGRPAVGVAERDERVRIVAGERLEQFDRAGRLAGLREVLAELDPHLALGDAVLQRDLERRDRVAAAGRSRQ